MTISILRFIIGSSFIVAGLTVFALSVFGVFKIKHGISRLHAAAMGDSSGILLVVVGAMIIFGNIATVGKLFFIVLLFWLASPVCSHLVAMLEVSTDEEMGTHCEFLRLEEVEANIIGGGTDNGRD